MGSSDSKLVFKQGIFKLSEPSTIPAEDPYWAGVTPPLPSPYLRAMLTVTSFGNCQTPAKMSLASFPPLMSAEPGTRLLKTWKHLSPP